jgi:heme-degrading monooxygenase HmoA
VILEAVILNIVSGQEKEFEAAFETASPIIASMNGYLWHQLQHCLETQHRYLLLVQW